MRLPRKNRRRLFASLVARLPLSSMKVLYEGAAPASQNVLEMLLQVLRLPRETNLRCSKCCACHAKTSLTCSKCCACHAKRGGAHAHHSSPDFRAPNVALATPNEPEVIQVLRLPHKTNLRCSKCCACHAKRGGAHSHHSSPDFRTPNVALATRNEPEVLQVLRLPRETNLRCSKCCACHAKTSLRCSKCCACHAIQGGVKKSWFVARLPPTSCVLSALLCLLCKMSLKCSKWCACHEKTRRRPCATRRQTFSDLYRCSKCCACHAKPAWGAPSAAPATQNEPEVPQVCACHAKRACGAPSAEPATPNEASPIRITRLLTYADLYEGARSAAPATQNEAAPKSISRRQTSADLYEGAPLAMQNEPEVLQVLRLHAKRGGNPKASPVARLPPTSMKVLQVLRLPRKTSRRCNKCCTCHAKRAGDAPSAAPATQNEAASRSITRRHTSADLYEGARSAAPAPQKRAGDALSAAPATQNQAAPKSMTRGPPLYEGAPSAAPATENEPEVLRMLRLPRKTNRRCSKCCACQAKRGGALKSITRRQTSADLYEGAPSAAPATQNEAAPKSITRRQTSADLYEGAPSAAHATENKPEMLLVLRLPRKTSRRCNKCCACHAKRAGDAPSSAPDTQNEPEVLQVLRLPGKRSCCRAWGAV